MLRNPEVKRLKSFSRNFWMTNTYSGPLLRKQCSRFNKVNWNANGNKVHLRKICATRFDFCPEGTINQNMGFGRSRFAIYGLLMSFPFKLSKDDTFSLIMFNYQFFDTHLNWKLKWTKLFINLLLLNMLVVKDLKYKTRLVISVWEFTLHFIHILWWCSGSPVRLVIHANVRLLRHCSLNGFS